jgi:hypothetical protein
MQYIRGRKLAQGLQAQTLHNLWYVTVQFLSLGQSGRSGGDRKKQSVEKRTHIAAGYDVPTHETAVSVTHPCQFRNKKPEHPVWDVQAFGE